MFVIHYKYVRPTEGVDRNCTIEANTETHARAKFAFDYPGAVIQMIENDKGSDDMANGHGGARPGAGRPPGHSPKNKGINPKRDERPHRVVIYVSDAEWNRIVTRSERQETFMRTAAHDFFAEGLKHKR